MTKPLIRWICKALCAGLLALAPLCGCWVFECNVSVRYPQPTCPSKNV